MPPLLIFAYFRRVFMSVSLPDAILLFAIFLYDYFRHLHYFHDFLRRYYATADAVFIDFAAFSPFFRYIFFITLLHTPYDYSSYACFFFASFAFSLAR